MQFGIVVDATCDLPQKFFADNPVCILPITVHHDGDTFVDHHELNATIDYYRSGRGDTGHSAETVPYTTEQIRDLFLDKLVLDYDCVFCLTVTANRSEIHHRATEASYAILRKYRQVRQQARIAGPFLMRVVDTENVFSAQGVTALEAARMIREDASPGRIRERLETIANHTWGYLVPRDLGYVRARTRKRGDRSVSLLSATLGGALDIKPILQCLRGQTQPVHKVRGFDQAARDLFVYAANRVRDGLLTRSMCISYGGDLSELRRLPGYTELESACMEHQITLHASIMSITGMVNVGPGGLSMGFAAEPHTPTFG